MAQDRHAIEPRETERNCSQFDYLLVAIPLALLAGVGSAVFLPIRQVVGLTLGAAVAASLVGYGVYAIAQSVCTTPENGTDSHTVAE